MEIEITYQDTPDRAAAQLTEFLVFLENQKENKIIISVNLSESERLALEFYAYQHQVRVEDLIDAAIRSHFQRFFEFL